MAKRLHMMARDPQLPPASVSNVLDDDELLMEIVVRVGSPAGFVRAAGVCVRWLRLVSDRRFLCRFRKLHPPRLLGFYLAQGQYPSPAAHFIPMLPQDQRSELAAVVRRTSFWLGAYKGARTDMVGCWNGRVVISSVLTSWNEDRREIVFVLHSPLCSKRGMAVIPALQCPIQESNVCSYEQLFSKEEGDALSYFYVMVECTMDRTKSIVHESTMDPTKSIVHVYMLQNGDDAWRTHLTLAADNFVYAQSTPRSVLVDNKVYMASTLNEIIVLDLTASSFSTIQLPQGLGFNIKGTTMLSQADDAPGVYIIHAYNLQLHIWLHMGGKWFLEDNICLRQMCANLPEYEPTALIEINHVGVYTGFVFLKMGRCALYLDVKHKTLHKVYEMTQEDRYFGRIYPFMMIWPPIFPKLNDVSQANLACKEM